MAHTPGPWWQFQDSTGSWGVATYRDHQVAPDPIPVGYDLGAAICHSIGDHTEKRTSENREANARLIASAPDLLEAVQNLMGLFDTPVVRRRLKDDALYPEVINQARAAIARAKGE